jgi:hypothetical protein
MSEELISNLVASPQSYDYVDSWGKGVAQQFRVLTATTVSSVKFMVQGFGYASGNAVAKIYASSFGFRDMNAEATGAAIATSTNTIDIETFPNGNGEPPEPFGEIEFTFDDVELAPGVYFVSLEVPDLAAIGEGYPEFRVAEDGSNWNQFFTANLGVANWSNSDLSEWYCPNDD